MKRAAALLLAAVLGVGVLAAIVISIRGRAGNASGQPLTMVRGVIGSEKQPFFNDPEVIRAFHNQGLDVKVDTAGSRQIATSVDLSRYDFAFPAGVPAAEKIKARSQSHHYLRALLHALESVISTIENQMKGATP